MEKKIISTKEMKDILKKLIYLKREDKNLRLVPLFIGDTGIGKTEIIKSIARELRIPAIIIHLQGINPIFVGGLPTMDGEWINIKGLLKFLEDPEKEEIVFFDEITTVAPEIQNIILQVLAEGVWRGVDVRNKIFVLAGNEQDNNANTLFYTYELSDALKNRLVIFEVHPNADDWLEWANKRGLHPIVIEFIRENPDYIFKRSDDVNGNNNHIVSPRTWEKVGVLLQKSTDDTSLIIVEALLGSKVFGKLVEFIEIYKRIPNVEQTLAKKWWSNNELEKIFAIEKWSEEILEKQLDSNIVLQLVLHILKQDKEMVSDMMRRLIVKVINRNNATMARIILNILKNPEIKNITGVDLEQLVYKEMYKTRTLSNDLLDKKR